MPARAPAYTDAASGSGPPIFATNPSIGGPPHQHSRVFRAPSKQGFISCRAARGATVRRPRQGFASFRDAPDPAGQEFRPGARNTTSRRDRRTDKILSVHRDGRSGSSKRRAHNRGRARTGPSTDFSDRGLSADPLRCGQTWPHKEPVRPRKARRNACGRGS